MVTRKLEALSNTVVSVMEELTEDIMLCRLLLNDVPEPLHLELPSDFKNRDIITPKSKYCRISPTPFDPNATVEDKSFIRVYYNLGKFDTAEVIAESEFIVDIIVAKNLWLIGNEKTNRSLIRPYEIAGRVIDRVGRRSLNGKTKIPFHSWRLLAVNEKFDAFRLYSDDFSIEADSGGF